jgi:hypothetical protein
MQRQGGDVRTTIKLLIGLSLVLLLGAGCASPAPPSATENLSSSPSPSPTASASPLTFYVEVDGVVSWQERCVGVNESICTVIGEVAVQTLGGRGPGGTVVVLPRSACPAPMPTWADPSQCWQVNLQLEPTQAECVLVGRGTDGTFRQLVGEPATSLEPSASGGCPGA